MTVIFFNDTATTEIYTLSLHDALPISTPSRAHFHPSLWLSESHDLLVNVIHRRQNPIHFSPPSVQFKGEIKDAFPCKRRSEEHTSELQSQSNIVCRLLLEKKMRLPSIP